MICQNSKNRKRPPKTTGRKRHQPSRGQGWGRGGGNHPPGLGGVGGPEVQKERTFGGLEKRGRGENKSEDHKNGGRSIRRPIGSADYRFISFCNILIGEALKIKETYIYCVIYAYIIYIYILYHIYIYIDIYIYI